MFTFEQKLTEDEEFSNVVFVKVDCDELEVCIKPEAVLIINMLPAPV